MRSTYVLIEQSELQNFHRQLDALHAWARNMSGLSTSITTAAPLGMPAVRPEPRYHAVERPRPFDPFASSFWNTSSKDDYNTTPPAPRSQTFQHNQNFNRQFDGSRQGYENVEYREPAPMRHGSRLPPGALGRRGAGSIDVPCARHRASGRPWQAPVRNGPHRTPVITRVPDNSHTPQRGAMFVRRPRRARPQRNAGNAEAMDDEAEDSDGEEYVEEEDDRAVGDEQEAR